MFDLFQKFHKLLNRKSKSKKIAKKTVTPILESFSRFQVPERCLFGEDIFCTGKIANDGCIRFFYDRQYHSTCVELEIDDVVFDLRRIKNHPSHVLWKKIDRLISRWNDRHGIVATPLSWMYFSKEKFP